MPYFNITAQTGLAHLATFPTTFPIPSYPQGTIYTTLEIEDKCQPHTRNFVASLQDIVQVRSEWGRAEQQWRYHG